MQLALCPNFQSGLLVMFMSEFAYACSGTICGTQEDENWRNAFCHMINICQLFDPSKLHILLGLLSSAC